MQFAEFLVDANLPKRFRFWQQDPCEMLPDSQWPDHLIWQYARQRKQTIVTKDNDFERLALSQGPPVVIRLCVGPASRKELWGILERWWPVARDASRQPSCRLVRIYPDWVEVVEASQRLT